MFCPTIQLPIMIMVLHTIDYIFLYVSWQPLSGITIHLYALCDVIKVIPFAFVKYCLGYDPSFS